MNVMKRLTVIRKVQKTGYRARVITIAQHFKLNGYVQNLQKGDSHLQVTVTFPLKFILDQQVWIFQSSL